MGREEYDELENMHGLIKIRFGQSKLKFPFFLFSMQSGSLGTLAPVMQCEEYCTIPHVRMAFDIPGMEIHLFDCEYCKNTCEPFNGYMGLIEKFKIKQTNRRNMLRKRSRRGAMSWVRHFRSL